MPSISSMSSVDNANNIKSLLTYRTTTAQQHYNNSTTALQQQHNSTTTALQQRVLKFYQSITKLYSHS